jgi:hypothetical protein
MMSCVLRHISLVNGTFLLALPSKLTAPQLGHKINIKNKQTEKLKKRPIVASQEPKSGAVGGVHHIHTMPSRNASSLHWSPSGRFLLLAGLKGGHNGKLEWWDVETSSVIGAGEHFMATEVRLDLISLFTLTSFTRDLFFFWSVLGTGFYFFDNVQWRCCMLVSGTSSKCSFVAAFCMRNVNSTITLLFFLSVVP